MANEVVVDIIARLDGIERSLKQAEEASKKSGKKIGDELGKKLEASTRASFKKIAGVAAAAAASIVAAFSIKKAISAAIEQENAVNRMNNALASAGTYSEEASRGIQAFASEIQRTTTFGDEAVLGFVALARNMTKTNDEAVKLTKAALDLSVATGMSVEGAIKNLGKTLSGLTGELGESLPAVKQFTQEQLKSGAAIDLVAKRFKGMAEGEVNTFAGAMKQAENTFGDFMEKIGEIVTQNKPLTKVLKEISGLFGGMAGSFDRNRKVLASFVVDVLKPIVQGFAFAAKGALAFLDGLNDISVIVESRKLESLETALKKNQAALEGLGSATAMFSKEAAGPLEENIARLKEEIKLQEEALVASTNKHAERHAALQDMFTQIDQFQGRISEIDTSDPLGPASSSIKNNLDAAKQELFSFSIAWGEISSNMFSKFGKDAEERFKAVRQEAQTLSGYFNSAFVSGISSAFQSFGAALAQGNNGFAEFGKSILKSLGQLAIQLGSFFIAVGAGLMATTVLFGFSGGAAIAAGVALNALGGALMALAGGGGGGDVDTAPASGGGGVATGGAPGLDNPVVAAQEPEERQPETNIAVNIEGNVLGDKRTLGREIAEAINEAFGSDGIVIARGVTV